MCSIVCIHCVSLYLASKQDGINRLIAQANQTWGGELYKWRRGGDVMKRKQKQKVLLYDDQVSLLDRCILVQEVPDDRR